MKNLTILLMCFLFSINVQCESVYRIRVNRALLSKLDPRYITGKVWVSKIDRYTNGVNGNISILRDFPNDMKVKLRVYEFLHNEYRPFAINLERPICAFLQLEYKNFFYPDFVKVGANMPEPKCPVLKGNYTFANYTVDDTNFPPTLPFKNSMMEISYWLQNEESFVLQVYITFDRDVIIRERYT